MAQSKTAMRKPIFTKVDQLQPETNGHNLTVKVISSNMVLQKVRPDGAQARPAQIAECLVGDETGTIVFTARNGQVDLMMPDTTVILRNAKIDMFKGSMRLAVDKWGRIEVTEPASFDIKEDNNLSLVEYELVNAVGHPMCIGYLQFKTQSGREESSAERSPYTETIKGHLTASKIALGSRKTRKGDMTIGESSAKRHLLTRRLSKGI
ncbi:hypothetical protein Nepgr_016212 [Nepenthes gracilis]|uniref:Single-stranded DNA binding protein Ssb-like OB fold domain-containing protein n=1 Tax=Nepenthes gracilis TaxID=150966 RepID=A0AAD3XS24_NEPGR|nr:hypothetical protein Nepgr_016212 [Nepenthes gracilis]